MNFDSLSRTDTIARGVTTLIAGGGMSAVTMRAIAAETGVSQASLAAHLGNRQHLLQVVAHRFGRLRTDRMEDRAFYEGALALLPIDMDDVVELRIWLSWCDLGRTNEGVGNAVAEAEAREHWLVVGLLAHEFDEEPGTQPGPRLPGPQALVRLAEPEARTVVGAAHDVLSIVHGLRHQVCSPGSAYNLEEANQTAERLIAAARSTWRLHD